MNWRIANGFYAINTKFVLQATQCMQTSKHFRNVLNPKQPSLSSAHLSSHRAMFSQHTGLTQGTITNLRNRPHIYKSVNGASSWRFSMKQTYQFLSLVMSFWALKQNYSYGVVLWTKPNKMWMVKCWPVMRKINLHMEQVQKGHCTHGFGFQKQFSIFQKLCCKKSCKA